MWNYPVSNKVFKQEEMVLPNAFVAANGAWTLKSWICLCSVISKPSRVAESTPPLPQVQQRGKERVTLLFHPRIMFTSFIKDKSIASSWPTFRSKPLLISDTIFFFCFSFPLWAVLFWGWGKRPFCRLTKGRCRKVSMVCKTYLDWLFFVSFCFLAFLCLGFFYSVG